MVVFIGMGSTVLSVVLGKSTVSPSDTPFSDGLLTGAPIVLFMALVLLLGVYLPPQLKELLEAGAAFLEKGQP